MASKFKVKAYSVVISHSDEDNERLKDPKFRELLLHEFVNECKNRGIDLDNIPYIIPEHTNTDNDHYHMLMLINHFDGTRIDTQYLGKRMALAAVDVSKKYGLHYPEGWDEREERKKKHQASGLSDNKRERKPRTRINKPATPGITPVTSSKVGLSEEEERKLKDRIRRRNAIRDAQQRKEKEDEAKRQAERSAKEAVKVQEQEAKRGEKNGQSDDKPETERKVKSGFHL